jgi:spore coat protein A
VAHNAYPSPAPVSGIPGITWIGEYFGDVMLVNGKVWPYLEVEPRLYRFRVLNGCNARIMSLRIQGAPVWQIGAEGGLWDRPVPMSQVVLAPAERSDLIVDFRGLAGQTLLMSNSTPAAPVSTPAPPLASVMQLRVAAAVTRPGPSGVPSSLPGHAAHLPAPHATRYISLNEVAPHTAGRFLNLNGARFGGALEYPRAGNTEDWVYVNLTPDTPSDAHSPVHLPGGRPDAVRRRCLPEGARPRGRRPRRN